MTMNEKKATKKEMFEAIKTALTSGPDMVAVELLDFIDKELAALDKKAESAKKARDKKKVEDDALMDEVFACLNDTSFTVIPQIMKHFEDREDITQAKITARLTKLFNAGKVEKDTVNVAAEGEKARKLVGYRVIV